DIKTLLQKLDPDGVGQITFQDFCRRFHDSLGRVNGELENHLDTQKPSSQDSDPLEDSCFEADSTYSTTSTNEYNGDDDEAFLNDGPLNSSFKRNLKQYSTYPPPTEPRTKHRSLLPRLHVCHDNRSHSDTSECQSEEGYEGFGERLSEETLQDCESVKLPIVSLDRFNLQKSYSSNSLPFRRRISANAAALLSSPRLFQSLSANTSRRNSMDDLCGSDCSGPFSEPEAGNNGFLFNEIQKLSSQVSILVEDQKLQTNKQYRIKDDNNDLSMRINALEDQLHHQHEKTGEKVLQESRKYKSALSKLEKDNEETLGVLTSKLRQAEEEIDKLKIVEPMLRKELDICHQENKDLLKHLDQLEAELQSKKDENDLLRTKLEVQAEAALEERHRHEEEEHILTQRLLELENFKSEAEVKLKDTLDLEQKSIELEERVQQLTQVRT
ncbi:hypothetical protein QZH41_015167, partial [Actinostola sp. cb2023]